MNNTERNEALRLAAVAVASEMRSPKQIYRGLNSITSFHSPKLARIVERLHNVPQEALDRTIWFEPRH